ncbi:MAG: hypothetical protein JSU64_05400 [candidate division WOR-3 bacterium]|nr:MAG: hypothetical protein JSU64_05400 [candidate division WOR-3 bacterium]
MKRIFASILLACIVLFVGTCGGEGDGENDGYYPLSIGNTWDYMVGMTVEQPGTISIFMGNSRDEIIGTTQLAGGTSVFEWITSITLDGYSDSGTFYIHETDTAVYVYESLNDTVPDRYLELPLENGNTWTVNSDVAAIVLGIVDVSVPAGNYTDCWEIAYIQSSDTTFAYLARGIGEVKGWAQTSIGDTTVTLRLDLESATIQ